MNFVRSLPAALPVSPLARWASVLFSLSILTCLISLAASQALLAAGAIPFLVHLFKTRGNVNFPPVKLPLAVFCLLSVASVLWSTNPAAGGFVIRKLTLFGIWLLAANLVVSERHLRFLYQELFLGSALAGLLATSQFVAQFHKERVLHPNQIYDYMTFTRITGFMGHWMSFGGQQMLVFVALLAFLLLARGRNETAPLDPSIPKRNLRLNRWWWLVLGVVGLSIVLNLTRGVWVGCFVAGVYLLGCWRPRWLWALPAVLILALLAAPSVVRERVKSVLHPTADAALSIRFEMWNVGLRMIRQHPWLGVGPNSIPQVYVLYLPPGKAPEAGYRDHLHNNLLQIGAERGLPCLAAWVWLMGALGWQTWKARRKLTRDRWVADAALAAWLALLVEGLFEFNFGSSPVLMVYLFMAATPFAAAQIEAPRIRQKASEP